MSNRQSLFALVLTLLIGTLGIIYSDYAIFKYVAGGSLAGIISIYLWTLT